MNGHFKNLAARVGVAAIAIPLILWSAMAGGYFFFAVIAVISAFSLHEFYGLMARKGAFPLVFWGLAAGVLVNGAFVYERSQLAIYEFFSGRGIPLDMFSQSQLLLVVQVLFVLGTITIELFRTQGSPSLNVGSTIAGVFVISLSFGLLIGLRELFPQGFPVHKFLGVSKADAEQALQINRWGGLTVAALFASLWVCDTAAYAAGGLWGKHKLFERVSPGKTWEGAIAGLIGALVTMMMARSFMIEYLSLADSVIIGLIVGALGQMGDLIESRFKRDAGVKDSSSRIPGHGGMYDRFDSLVFVAPIVYLYVDFVVLS